MSEKKPKSWKKFKEDYNSTQDELEEKAELELEDDFAEDAPLPSYKELEDELAVAKKQAEDNLNTAKRALADMENLKRRLEIDLAKAHQFGQSRLITDLLPVVDSLEQALQMVDAKDSAMKEGLELTLKLFLDVLKKNAVEQIDPQNLIFNPEEHEAMAMVDAPDAKASSIVSVFQKGYKLNGRVIRPARVIVAKAQS